jgi:hypothetical protein
MNKRKEKEAEFSQKKRVCLTVSQKKEICLKYQETPRPTQYQLALEYGCKANTISDIIKESKKWLSIDENSHLTKKKRIRECRFPEIDAALTIWFMQALPKNIVITGEVLQQKARDFAKAFDISDDNFKASEGWLDGFKKRHHIQEYNRSGEANSAPLATLDDEREKLYQLIQNYKLKDVFNCDETGNVNLLLNNLNFLN